MLVSRRHNIAFAHYPKTAGSSLQRWFLDAFPDAEYLEPLDCHLTVPRSLDLLQSREQGWRRRATNRVSREVGRLCRQAGMQTWPSWPWSLRVIGALRDPFETIVSLYEYWKGFDFPEEPTAEFQICARQGAFRDFLAAAVIGDGVQPYDTFFGCGGPLWANTRLLAFDSLDPALEVVCEEFGLRPPERLPQQNVTPNRQNRNLDRYRDEAGPLMHVVHRRFRWYYEEGVHLMIRGKQPLRTAA
jgi:hypothetical protein